MKVNIVTEQKDKAWILRRLSEELAILDDVTLDEPAGADAQYFINYALFNKDLPGAKIAYFTHLEEGGVYRQRFRDVMELCDLAIMMNEKLITHPEKSRVIMPGTDLYCHEPVFGVVGRLYKTGRKGERLVQKMVDDGFDVRAWGHGWPCRIEGSGQDGLGAFYGSIDYLVIPSLNEGGPVPILEAMAMNIPVIAPDVGFCWDFPVIKYEVGNWNSLNDVLSKLARPRSWEDWRDDHRELFSKIGAKICQKKSSFSRA